MMKKPTVTFPIIEKLGGVAKVVQILRDEETQEFGFAVTKPERIRMWLYGDRANIPTVPTRLLMRAAERLGVPYTSADFFPKPATQEVDSP